MSTNSYTMTYYLNAPCKDTQRTAWSWILKVPTLYFSIQTRDADRDMNYNPVYVIFHGYWHLSIYVVVRMKGFILARGYSITLYLISIFLKAHIKAGKFGASHIPSCLMMWRITIISDADYKKGINPRYFVALQDALR